MPSDKRQPPIEILSRLLAYNASTGRLTWRKRDPSLFEDGKRSAAHNCAVWNGKFAGKPALNWPDQRGYLCGHILKIPMKSHRVIWAMEKGVWPEEIDHINGVCSDNRIENLRSVPHRLNGKNTKLKSNNKSGFCGIRQVPSGRWAAAIMVDGKSLNLGTFDTIDEAVAARTVAEEKHQFHVNHGKR